MHAKRILNASAIVYIGGCADNLDEAESKRVCDSCGPASRFLGLVSISKPGPWMLLYSLHLRSITRIQMFRYLFSLETSVQLVQIICLCISLLTSRKRILTYRMTVT